MIPSEQQSPSFHLKPASELPQETLTRIHEIFFDHEKSDEQRNADVSKEFERFFQRLKKDVARKETFELMLHVCYLFISSESLDASKLIQRICKGFDEWYLKKNCKNESEINEIIFSEIPMDIWAECIRRIIFLDITDCAVAVDKLFHIKAPRSNTLNLIIQQEISRLMEKPWTFLNAVFWITVFNMDEPKNQKFEEIIYRSYIYRKTELLQTFLNTEEDKLKYLKILDQCYARGKVNDNKNVLELKFFEAVGYDNVPDLINEKAKEFGIIVNTPDFCFFRIRDMNK